jgi:hypothetical protein
MLPLPSENVMHWLMVMGRKKVALTIRKCDALADGDG